MFLNQQIWCTPIDKGSIIFFAPDFWKIKFWIFFLVPASDLLFYDLDSKWYYEIRYYSWLWQQTVIISMIIEI